MQLSAQGLGFLKRHEGFRSHLYNDATGNATIGYGHLVHMGMVGSKPELEAKYAVGISEPAAAVLLAADTRNAENAVRLLARPTLQQHEFDALVSFVFNVGVRAFEGSTLRRYVNSLATPDAIETAWLMWDKPHAILGRRRDEVALFNQGIYGGPVP